MKISIELDKLENLVLELMEKYKSKEITRDEFTKILEYKGYKSISIDNDTLYVTSGKILSALFDTIGSLTDENKQLKHDNEQLIKVFNHASELIIQSSTIIGNNKRWLKTHLQKKYDETQPCRESF
jgi:hypothetical protein